MPATKRPENLKSHRELLADELSVDAEFSAEWSRTALARSVAVEVLRYRAAHGLSQTDLAKRLKMRQPQVARIESGETNPTFETLIRLADGLQIELAIDILPASKSAKLLSAAASKGKSARRQIYRCGDVAVLVAAT